MFVLSWTGKGQREGKGEGEKVSIEKKGGKTTKKKKMAAPASAFLVNIMRQHHATLGDTLHGFLAFSSPAQLR